MDDANPGLGRVAGGRPEALVADFTDEEDAHSERSYTLIDDVDGSSADPSPTPPSNVQISRGMSNIGDSFPSSSTATTGRGDEKGHIYHRVKATGESVQINGDILTSFALPRTSHNYYVDAIANEKSWQFNGNVNSDFFLEFIKSK